MSLQQSRVATTRAQVLTGALVEVCSRLNMGPSILGKTIGISQPTASRLLRGSYQLRDSAKEWELSAVLVRLYRSLFAMVGGDEVLAREWLRAPNRAFADDTPLNMLLRVEGLLRVSEYLDAHRSRI